MSVGVYVSACVCVFLCVLLHVRLCVRQIWCATLILPVADLYVHSVLGPASFLFGCVSVHLCVCVCLCVLASERVRMRQCIYL